MTTFDSLEHPAWCDPQQCGAADRSSYHRSAVHVIDSPARGGVSVAVQLACEGDEPLGDAPVTVGLTLTRGEYTSVEEYHLAYSTASGLQTLLDRLLQPAGQGLLNG